MKPIIRRIQKLEEKLPPPESAPEGPSVGEQIEDGLARIGFVRGEGECLMDVFARYLGITLRELRARLAARAYGKVAGAAIDITR
jgi:hypothetical protein